ncbi:MAG: helicase HerA-like domain-containing protein [Sandaracinaceae bacterium]
MNEALMLGRVDDEPLSLAPSVLLRHLMALGASGSGKTVFCKVVVEEAVRLGLPSICIDPQGDLCSLGAGPTDPAELEAKGVAPELAGELAEKLDVVVFTPGSRAGIPLCADPVDAALATLDPAARIEAVTRTAAVVVSRIGFDLESDDGAGLAAVIDSALHEMIDAGVSPSLARLTEHLFAAEETEFAAYARLLDKRKIRTACQRLARLDVGARRALFHDGVPIDIDVLLGLDPRSPTPPGKTRVAVVYLNSLHQQEDKDFFVAALVDRLYAWMLRHPSAEPQALFYIDEVAPFIPPVRKPACKDGLSLLFKQARKYGVCCLMATQNPGDVDYRAMAQFGTWALGRLTTRQDLKKVAPTLSSISPDSADEVMGTLPSLEPGQLVLVCPDAFDSPQTLRARWLATRHETWSEERVREHAEPQRARFRELTEAPTPETPERSAPPEVTPPEVTPPEPTPAAGSIPSEVATELEAASPSPEPSTTERAHPETAGDPSSRTRAVGTFASPEASASVVEEEAADEDEDAPAATPAPERVDASSPTEAQVLAALMGMPSASVNELSAAVAPGASAVRRALSRLVEQGHAASYPDGRTTRYWARATEGRPDLSGMPHPVDMIVAQIDMPLAEEMAQQHARSRTLGVIGEDETFERAERVHRLVYKLDFEERVERGLLGRLFGDGHDDRLGSVYVHPHNLGVVLFESDRGLRFLDLPEGPASEIRDFDGTTEVIAVPPARLAIDDADWNRRLPVDAIVKSFANRFNATPGDVRPLFVPLYVLLFRTESGSLRRMQIDGVLGKPVRWLDPQ